MNKKVLICPLGIVFLLFGVFLFQKFYMILPFSHKDAYVLSNITFICVIAFSFIGTIQNINILKKKKGNAINFILSIVFTAIFLVTTFLLTYCVRV